MIDGKRVVYAYNAYYQGRQELGPTSSWEITWGNSLEHFFGPDIVRFNPDAYGPDSHAESDAALLELAEERDIQLLVMISHIGAGWRREFISKVTLAALRSRGIRVVSIWGDITHSTERHALGALRPEVDLNVCTSTSGAARRLARANPVLYSWVPLSDEKIEDPCDCGAMVSLAGSLKMNRYRTVDFLESRGIRVHAGGGEGNLALSRHDYLRMLAHPMTLGFSNNGFESVINARTFEALTQGTVLLEGWGRETAKVFIPYHEYVPWYDHSDLLRSIESLLAAPDERDRIASNGLTTMQRFTHAALWTRVLARVQLNTVDHGIDFLRPVDWSLYAGPLRPWERIKDTAMSEPRFEPLANLIQFFKRLRMRTVTWARSSARRLRRA